jgi:hypothetical protein
MFELPFLEELEAERPPEYAEEAARSTDHQAIRHAVMDTRPTRSGLRAEGLREELAAIDDQAGPGPLVKFAASCGSLRDLRDPMGRDATGRESS